MRHTALMNNAPTGNDGSPGYKAYSLHNFKQIPQLHHLPQEIIFAIEVVGHVLPFKTNRYVINELIRWENVPDDPIFRLTFPQKDMLSPDHFEEMAEVIRRGGSREEIEQTAYRIRQALNPHPAGQMEYNVPVMDGKRLTGIQHKYRETVLFFPRQGQTCHAYCSFCFRWPQFVGKQEWKFAMKEGELVVEYLRRHPEVTDVLFTGGDPMVMKSDILAGYIHALLNADLPNLQTIRIGSKSLAFYPYKYLEPDGENILRLFEEVTRAGKHLAFMAHFSHPHELETGAVQQAIRRIRSTGAQIRTQSPLLNHINAEPELWARMWKEQTRLGCIPYYMFVVRDTGAQHYFGVPLVQAWKIFKKAYQQVSGVARTVRGPSMSATPGKILVNGVSEIMGEKVFTLTMLQGRRPEWVNRPFFARYDETAVWLNELQPAFGKQRFFFEENMELMHRHKRHSLTRVPANKKVVIER